jgi:hypothetical protein
MLTLLLFAGLGVGEPLSDPVEALRAHLESHPRATPVDAYKFLHQGVFGPGHLIEDRTAAREFLEREINSLDRGVSDEPLCEGLGGEPALVRIHLRPFLEAGERPADLLGAFVDSANRVSGDADRMALVLTAAVERLRRTGRDDLADGLDRLRSELAAEGFPALHHAAAFRDAYRPAYRVVLLEIAEDRGWCRPSGPS